MKTILSMPVNMANIYFYKDALTPQDSLNKPTFPKWQPSVYHLDVSVLQSIVYDSFILHDHYRTSGIHNVTACS
eukprot:m.57026 g.57026  ORF g.57026 m.57026 type:complete len:74 (-) comp11076_c0_seq1:1670-1891(-)